MKKNAVLIGVIALAVGIAAGIGLSALINPAGKPQEVRAASAEGESIEQLVGDLDQQLSKLEDQFKQIKRTPQLEDQVFPFDLHTAASQGPENAKLTMVVFSDFECPFCRKFAEAAALLRTKFPNDLRLAFLNFPLDNTCNSAMSRPFHQRACMGAMAAAYAQEQGKFWLMHDWLFQNQTTYSPDSIAAFAAEQGMDAAAIKSAIETLKYKDLIGAQAQQLLPTGSRGTPTVFINGKKVSNVRWDDLTGVAAFIDDLLNPKPKTEDNQPAPTVKNPSSLPPARVILPDGVSLEDKLANLRSRLTALELPGPGNQPSRAEPKRPDPNKVYTFDNSKSPALGPESAKVTLTVFSDFRCPHCYRLAGVLKKLHEQFPNDLRIVFKNVPNHQGSAEAHEAAMEAFAQGKFWEMHDLLFENREQLTPELIAKLAEQAGLNMEQFKAAMADHRHRAELTNDLKQADQASLGGTPTVFINGHYLNNTGEDGLVAAIKGILGQ
jgi:protein-disulfide isomerase